MSESNENQSELAPNQNISPENFTPIGEYGQVFVNKVDFSDTVNVGIQEWKGRGMPQPIPIKHKEYDPNAYLPEHISDEYQKTLKDGATAYAKILNVYRIRQPWMGLGVEHLNWYLEGSGKDKELDPSRVDELMQMVEPVTESQHDAQIVLNKEAETDKGFKTSDREKRDGMGTILYEFIKIVKEQFKVRNTQYIGYISYNKNTILNSKHWFSTQVFGDKDWYYGLGGFNVSYACWLIRGLNNLITVHWTMFISDRYDWNPDSNAANPNFSYEQFKEQAAARDVQIANQLLGDPLSDLFKAAELPTEYFDKAENTTKPAVMIGPDEDSGAMTISDNFMGAQEVLQGAKPYNIFGEGRHRIFTYKEE